MRKPLFTGVCTALVTPFLDGKVNYPMLEILLRRQLEAGIKAVVLAGTTGEAPTLKDEEKKEIFRRCKEYVGDQMLIVAGTGSNATDHAIRMSIDAEDAGADALLVVSPYYNKSTASGLVAHYAAIAQAVRLPVIIYNVPSRTGQDIPVDVYRKLSCIDNIVGVKEASKDITKITDIRSFCGPNFAVWSGNDDIITPVIALGGSGVISVASNVIPQQIRYLTEAALAGDLDSAAALQTELSPLIHALFQEVNPIPVKKAMGLIGYDCGNCRMPLTNPSGKTEEILKTLFGK